MSESNEANLGFSHIVVVSTATYLPVYCKDKRTCSNDEMKSAQDIMAQPIFCFTVTEEPHAMTSDEKRFIHAYGLPGQKDTAQM